MTEAKDPLYFDVRGSSTSASSNNVTAEPGVAGEGITAQDASDTREQEGNSLRDKITLISITGSLKRCRSRKSKINSVRDQGRVQDGYRGVQTMLSVNKLSRRGCKPFRESRSRAERRIGRIARFNRRLSVYGVRALSVWLSHSLTIFHCAKMAVEAAPSLGTGRPVASQTHRPRYFDSFH